MTVLPGPLFSTIFQVRLEEDSKCQEQKLKN